MSTFVTFCASDIKPCILTAWPSPAYASINEIRERMFSQHISIRSSKFFILGIVGITCLEFIVAWNEQFSLGETKMQTKTKTQIISEIIRISDLV